MGARLKEQDLGRGGPAGAGCARLKQGLQQLRGMMLQVAAGVNDCAGESGFGGGSVPGPLLLGRGDWW